MSDDDPVREPIQLDALEQLMFDTHTRVDDWGRVWIDVGVQHFRMSLRTRDDDDGDDITPWFRSMLAKALASVVREQQAPMQADHAAGLATLSELATEYSRLDGEHRTMLYERDELRRQRDARTAEVVKIAADIEFAWRNAREIDAARVLAEADATELYEEFEDQLDDTLGEERADELRERYATRAVTRKPNAQSANE